MLVLYLDVKRGDVFMEIDFLKDNFEYYVNNSFYSTETCYEQLNIVKQELLKKNCIFLTIEERDFGKLERITIPVSYVDDEFVGEGFKFYNMEGEEVFRYYKDRKLGFYYNPLQIEEYYLIKQGTVDYSEDWLKWVVDYAYEDYFGKAQNWFGSGNDLILFCEKLYMSKSSRLKLEELVLRRKMKNYEERYGCENSILKKQLDDLYV